MREILPVKQETSMQEREALPVKTRPAEKTRSPEIRTMQKFADDADDAFELVMFDRSAENPEAFLRDREAYETLRYGKELERKYLNGGSRNIVTRRVFEGDPPLAAYAKPQSGEASFAQSTDGKPVERRRYWNPNSNAFEVDEAPLKKKEAKYFDDMLPQLPDLRKQIAEYYEIRVEELPMTPDVMSLRQGIEAGTYAEREYAVSRLSHALGLDVVPMTVLRTESDHDELASIQEAVPVTDLDRLPRPMRAADNEEIRLMGDAHPGAESLMRIACLDYLVRNTDRHHENILYDPAAKKFHAIDHGLAFPMTGADILRDNGGIRAQMLESIPLEIVEKDLVWKLDDRALDRIKDVYGRVMLDRSSERTGQVQQPETKLFEAVFRLMFKNEKIAETEMELFLERLLKVIENGRPPLNLPIRERADELFANGTEKVRTSMILNEESAESGADTKVQVRTAAQ